MTILFKVKMGSYNSRANKNKKYMNGEVIVKQLLISEVSSLLGVEPATIRYWERNGLLHLRRDPENSYRYFD